MSARGAVERGYYEPLQSMRGFGVLMVAFYHCQGVIGGELPAHLAAERGLGTAPVIGYWLAITVFNGHGALMAFFVLSGFVLALSLRRGPHGAVAGGLAFSTARLFRIIPANAVAVLVAVAIAALTGIAPQARLPPPWGWPRIVANMAVVETTIIPVAWSLAVELLAIPFIFALYLLARRSGAKSVGLATAIALGLSFAPASLGFAPLGRNLFAIFTGVLVAQLGPRVVGAISRRQAAIWYAGAGLTWFASRPLLGMWSHWPSVVETGGAAVLIALLAFGPRLPSYRAFELRPILWLGEISYSLYLYHCLLWWWVAPPASSAVFLRLGDWGPLTAVVTAWIASVAAATPFAWLSYAAVERGGIRAGRALSSRIAPRRALASAPGAVRTT